MAGYECHAVTCGSCGTELEWHARYGEVVLTAEYTAQVTQYVTEWGRASVTVSPEGYEDVEREEEFGSEVDDYEVTELESQCPGCNNMLRPVFWGWHDASQDADALMLILGRSPSVGLYDGIEVMDAGRFIGSFNGALEEESMAGHDEAEAWEPGMIRVVETLPEFPEDEVEADCNARADLPEELGEVFCCRDYGHDGPHMLEEAVEVDGTLYRVWDGDADYGDARWWQEEAEVAAAARREELARDPLAELGLG